MQRSVPCAPDSALGAEEPDRIRIDSRSPAPPKAEAAAPGNPGEDGEPRSMAASVSLSDIIAATKPAGRRGDWSRYSSVNERFADTVAQKARAADPIVLIQDYRFALLPKLVRERLPDAPIVTFWHIP